MFFILLLVVEDLIFRHHLSRNLWREEARIASTFDTLKMENEKNYRAITSTMDKVFFKKKSLLHLTGFALLFCFRTPLKA